MLERQLEFVQDKFDFEKIEVGMAALNSEAKFQLRQTADELARLFAVDPETFLEGLDIVEAEFGEFGKATNFIADEVLKSIQETSDQDLGFSTRGGDTNFEDVIGQLDKMVFGWDSIGDSIDGAIGPQSAADMQALTDRMADHQERVDSLSRPPQFTSEQSAQFRELTGGIATAFDNARASIDATYNAIIEGSLAAAPFLDIYGGPTIQSLKEFNDGHDIYQENLLAIEALRARLVDDKSDLLPRFDESSVSDKAWLAALNTDGQDQALQSMQDSFDAAVEHGQASFLQSEESILAGVSEQLEVDLLALQVTAGDAGGLVGTEFDIKLNDAAALWPVTAKHWFDETLSAIAGSTGGTISGPSISAVITINNNNVRVQGPAAPNTPNDVRRGLQSIEGAG